MGRQGLTGFFAMSQDMKAIMRQLGWEKPHAYLTEAEVAEILSLEPATLSKQRSQGKRPGSIGKNRDGRILYRAGEFWGYLREKELLD